MITLEKIFCPTDLHSAHDDALHYALALAKDHEAKLYVCYVVETDALSDEAVHELRTQLTQTVQRHCYEDSDGRRGLPNWEPVIARGDAADVIPRTAVSLQADLIVMHSRRQSYVATLLGSTAEVVSRTAPCPVLITHSDEHDWVQAETGEIRLKNILMAYDFSNDAELALSLALLFAEQYQATLHLLHVLPGSNEAAPAGSDEQELLRLELQDVLPEEARLWCEVKTDVRTGIAYREILAYADENEIDLICLGSSNGGTLQTLIESHVEPILRQASCPVLIARPVKAARLVRAETKADPRPLVER
ncbi:MAG TPA: universal stress protein [Blastocatellia bacterium]|nr:universal stress protein [Blastocatellia bacterium]